MSTHTDFLENIIALTPGHVYWKDIHGRYLGCNDAQAKSLGLKSRFEITQKKPYEHLPKEEAEALIRADEEVLIHGKSITKEEIGVRANGKLGTFLTKKRPLYDSNGKIVGLLGISFDITAEKEAEQLKNEQKVINERYAVMSTAAATIAHELRTPLATISLQLNGLQRFLPILIKSYQNALTTQQTTEKITAKQLDHLNASVAKIAAEVQASFHFIDMLLVSAKQPERDKPVEKRSIKTCIEDALNRYPFQPGQRRLVHVNADGDFEIVANNLLITHLFFNLLKNALHFIMAKPDGPGKIIITINAEQRKVYFKDTGTGMDAKALRQIFERFYSDTQHGTGIGLAFCKNVMEDLGGEISCDSVKGEFTEFILSFPPIK